MQIIYYWRMTCTVGISTFSTSTDFPNISISVVTSTAVIYNCIYLTYVYIIYIHIYIYAVCTCLCSFSLKINVKPVTPWKSMRAKRINKHNTKSRGCTYKKKMNCWIKEKEKKREMEELDIYTYIYMYIFFLFYSSFSSLSYSSYFS